MVSCLAVGFLLRSCILRSSACWYCSTALFRASAFSSSVSSTVWFTITWQERGFSDLYIILVIVVDCHRVHLSVREAVTTAPLYLVENVGYTIVYVLALLAVCHRKEFVFRCPLFQIGLYRSLEMVCCLHIVSRFNGLQNGHFQNLSPIDWLYLA